MPDSLESALVFSLLIVPGYLLLRGFYVGRAYVVPARDLYVLAQAVVASLFWLAATWLVVEDLLTWIDEDTLGDHTAQAYGIAALVVVAPFPVGRLVGAFVSGAIERQTPGVYEALSFLFGVDKLNTAWERAWVEPLRNAALVEVHLDDERTVLGQFADQSQVDLPPAVPQLYLEQTYQEENGHLREQGAAHIDGARIVSIRFVEIL